MAYKPPMTDEDRLLISNLAKNCISELGRVAGDGASTTGSSSRHEATEKKTSSVMSLFRKRRGTIADQGGQELFHDIHIQTAMHHVMRRPFISKGSLYSFLAPCLEDSSKLISAASGEERVA